jgi:hypothetical protein
MCFGVGLVSLEGEEIGVIGEGDASLVRSMIFVVSFGRGEEEVFEFLLGDGVVGCTCCFSF